MTVYNFPDTIVPISAYESISVAFRAVIQPFKSKVWHRGDPAAPWVELPEPAEPHRFWLGAAIPLVGGELVLEVEPTAVQPKTGHAIVMNLMGHRGGEKFILANGGWTIAAGSNATGFYRAQVALS